MAGTFQNPLMSSMATELPSSEYDPFGIDQILHEDESSTPTPTPLHLKAISLVLKFELEGVQLQRGQRMDPMGGEALLQHLGGRGGDGGCAKDR